MENRKKGFTLIELIVCIAIIAALGVSVGVGLTKVMRGTKNSRNEETFREIFEAAALYTQMKSFTCVKEGENCLIKLDSLISAGLLDKEIMERENPLYASKKTFAATTSDKLILSRDSVGEKIYTYECGNKNAKIELSGNDEIEDFTDWGKC